MSVSYIFTTNQEPTIKSLLKASKHKFNVQNNFIELEEADYKALHAILQDARLKALVAGKEEEENLILVLLSRLDILSSHFPNVSSLGEPIETLPVEEKK